MAYKGITSIIRKKTKRKGDHKHGLKLSKPILKQTIINPHSPLPLPCYPVFNSPKKHLIRLKLKRKIKNMEIFHLSWAAIPGMDRRY